jgi:hypothetical protein
MNGVRRLLVVLAMTALVLGVVGLPANAKQPINVVFPPAIRAYIKALASSTPAGAATAEKLTQPGSYAAVYTHAVGGVDQAAADSGQPFPATTPTFSPAKGRASLCSGTPPTCIVFSSFVVQAGKITDFTRNRNGFVGALSEGDGTSHDALGSSLTVVGAYMPDPARLIVDVAVKNGDHQLTFNFAGTYLGPDGHQVQSSQGLTASSDLRPGSHTTLAFVFQGVTVGGSVIVKCLNPATTLPADYIAETQMPVPVFQP